LSDKAGKMGLALTDLGLAVSLIFNFVQYRWRQTDRADQAREIMGGAVVPLTFCLRFEIWSEEAELTSHVQARGLITDGVKITSLLVVALKAPLPDILSERATDDGGCSHV
jgi:hypothetical protein